MGKVWLSSQNKGRWEHFGNVGGVLIGCWSVWGGCLEYFWNVGSSSGTLGAFGVDVGSYFEVE